MESFDEIEFLPHVPGSEQIDPELEKLFASCEFGNIYLPLCDEIDDEGEQPEINTNHINFAFNRFFAMIFCTVLYAFNNAPVVSGSLDSSWSKTSTFMPLNIQFSQLVNCEHDRVCAKPETAPKGVSFQAINLPEGMELDQYTGVLIGPASVDADAKIFVLVKSPGSWFGAPALQQSVEVVQHASRTEDAIIKREEDASIQRKAADAVASVSSAVLGVAACYTLLM
jgi:hypothetical protein